MKSKLRTENENELTIVTKEKKSKKGKIILTIILLICGLFSIFPFVFMISSSFKPLVDVFEYPIHIIPRRATLSNYINLFTGDYPFVKWYANTIITVLITIVLKSIITSMAAYAFARLKFKGRDVIFFIMLAGMMLPGDVLLISRYVVYKFLGITNSMWSIILLYTFEIFFVFMMRQFFRTIPFDLSEAAIVDGCNQFQVFLRVILPNVKPAFITMILFTFVWEWNDYMNPMIFITNTEKQMLSVGMQFFQERQGANYSMQMAAAALILLPVIIVFFSVQKYFIEGIASSGLKG